MSGVMTAVRLTLRQHTFELSTALALGGLVGLAAILISARFGSVGVPQTCFENSLTGGALAECGPYLRDFGRINEDEATRVFVAMAALPFAAGLLGGVPIVARELETRTAQTAWWLESSRRRWLAHQIVAPSIVLVASIGFSGATAASLQGVREFWSPTNGETVTLVGWPVLVRAFAAFGIGLFVGSLVGRVLPALIIGSLLSIGIVMAVTGIRMEWTYQQVEPVIDDPDWHGQSYGVAYVAPSGEVLSEAAATALAPSDASSAYDWLSDEGYREVEIGVSNETAQQWAAYDVAIFSGLALASTLTAFGVVARRRPR